MLVSLALGDANFLVVAMYISFFLRYPRRQPPTPVSGILGVGSSGVGHVYFMYISCIFHVVCVSFSALATRKLADAKADSSGIWALLPTTIVVISAHQVLFSRLI